MNEPTVEQPGARPETEQAAQRIQAYVLRHWRGENSLAYAFWVNFVLGVFLAESIVVVLSIATIDTVFDPGYVVYRLMRIAVLCVMFWASIGAWRSAGTSIASAGVAEPPRTTFWGYSARVTLVLILAVPIMPPFTIWPYIGPFWHYLRPLLWEFRPLWQDLVHSLF